MARGYTSVSVPDSLLSEIDEIVRDNNLGYTSRSEFVKEALRFHILRIRKIDENGEK